VKELTNKFLYCTVHLTSRWNTKMSERYYVYSNLLLWMFMCWTCTFPRFHAQHSAEEVVSWCASHTMCPQCSSLWYPGWRNSWTALLL